MSNKVWNLHDFFRGVIALSPVTGDEFEVWGMTLVRIPEVPDYTTLESMLDRALEIGAIRDDGAPVTDGYNPRLQRFVVYADVLGQERSSLLEIHWIADRRLVPNMADDYMEDTYQELYA